MTINKLIIECSRRNFARASKLFESELEDKVCEILNAEKEDMLDLEEFADETELATEAEDCEPGEVKTEAEADEAEEVTAESDEMDDEEVVATESEDELPMDDEEVVEEEAKTSFKVGDKVSYKDDKTGKRVSGVISKLTQRGSLWNAELKGEKGMIPTPYLKKESIDGSEEDDFEKIAESILFGKRR